MCMHVCACVYSGLDVKCIYSCESDKCLKATVLAIVAMPELHIFKLTRDNARLLSKTTVPNHIPISAVRKLPAFYILT